MANEAQEQAIMHKDGPMMVLAGPGSGKTYTMTRRIEHMIKVHKIPAESILVITFTKASAIEMQERFEKLMEDEYAPVNFGTFHAIYFHIIKETYDYSFENIITEKEKVEYMKSTIDELDDEDIDESLIARIISDISNCKNDGTSPAEYETSYLEEGQFQVIYDNYHKKLKDDKKIDFEDMVLMCRDLFINNPKILQEWQGRYKYILIDEFQDINPMQYQVIKLLAAPENNLFIVGDDDQSIYGFRGSEPKIMLNFPNEYENVTKIVLDKNYRSTEDIVNKAVVLVEHNGNRFSKKLSSEKGPGHPIQIMGFDNREEQYEHILKIIKTIKRNGNYGDIALIYRTNGKARMLTNILSENKIPYSFKEKPVSFWNNNVAKDILAMLAFAHGDRTRRNLFRFMNKPVRYISRDMIRNSTVNFEDIITNSNIKNYVKNNILRLRYDLDKINKMDIYSGFNYILKGMCYEKHILTEAKKNHQDVDEIKEILELIKMTCRSAETYEELLNCIEDYEEGLKNSASIKDDVEDKVNIVTMHGSKGLEYKTVIIPDVNEGYVPQSKATKNDMIEEERRVFYVAMTRAKENLHITYIHKGNENRHAPSRFIKEINI